MPEIMVCKTRAAATAALDTIAAILPRGTQRDALVAVKNWMIENFPADFTDDTLERIKKIFEGSEQEQAGRLGLKTKKTILLTYPARKHLVQSWVICILFIQ